MCSSVSRREDVECVRSRRPSVKTRSRFYGTFKRKRVDVLLRKLRGVGGGPQIGEV